MELERIIIPDGQACVVRQYGEGFIVINEDTIKTSAIVTPTEFDAGWSPACFDDLRSAHFESLLEHKPDLVLLGTGPRQRFPSPTILAPLYQAGIGVEVMDTGAACRTFNIVMSEGRHVVAGLLLE